MIVGCDTGFFVALLQNDSEAQSYWNQIVSGDMKAVVSVASLLELAVLAQKKHIDQEAFDILYASIQSLCDIIQLDARSQWPSIASKIAHSGLSVSVAMIVQSFLSSHVMLLLTDDPLMASFFPTTVQVKHILQPTLSLKGVTNGY